jgi:hypothetical protein
MGWGPGISVKDKNLLRQCSDSTGVSMEGGGRELPNKTLHSCFTVCFVNSSCVCKEENANMAFMCEEILKRIR